MTTIEQSNKNSESYQRWGKTEEEFKAFAIKAYDLMHGPSPEHRKEFAQSLSNLNLKLISLSASNKSSVEVTLFVESSEEGTFVKSEVGNSDIKIQDQTTAAIQEFSEKVSDLLKVENIQYRFSGPSHEDGAQIFKAIFCPLGGDFNAPKSIVPYRVTIGSSKA